MMKPGIGHDPGQRSDTTLGDGVVVSADQHVLPPRLPNVVRYGSKPVEGRAIR